MNETADDLVIRQLADDVARLEADAAGYRTMVLAALDTLHQAQIREQKLQEQLAEVRAEIRRYTAAKVC